MNLMKLVTLCALAAAPQAFASGSSAPQTEQPAPQPEPAPQPAPPPVDPTLGTRFATLRDLFTQASTAPSVSDSPTWAEYQLNPTISCTQIKIEYPNSFNNDVLLLRMHPINYNAGPVFPGERGDKFAAVRYSALGNYTDEGISNEMWENSVQTTTTNAVQLAYGSDYTYVFKKIGHLTVWHLVEQGDSDEEAYGYCFPKSEANPF